MYLSSAALLLFASLSSATYLLQVCWYVVCSNWPRHTQQKWLSHCLQCMWLHPPSLLIATLHFGQSLVFACSQLHVSLSSWHFFDHLMTSPHSAGAWGSPLQSKQKWWALAGSALQYTAVWKLPDSKLEVMRTAFEQSLPGHHFTEGLLLTYVWTSLLQYLSISASSPPWCSSLSTTTSSSTMLHRPVLPPPRFTSPAHGMRAACPSSSI
mmetsp:Transcript_19843/g.45681  ORF Transcript_19843/g.45681 Transcript_19843/m.45681 type:complete len:210 (-) Transcript_19843:535-1164(-)